MVGELGASDEVGGRGFLELVPSTSTGEEVVSEARGPVFGTLSYIKMRPMILY
jgi:hypothetical protein